MHPILPPLVIRNLNDYQISNIPAGFDVTPLPDCVVAAIAGAVNAAKVKRPTTKLNTDFFITNHSPF